MNDKIMAWPDYWRQSAVNAGFARYEGVGSWQFVDDSLADKLEDFGNDISKESRKQVYQDISDILLEYLRDPNSYEEYILLSKLLTEVKRQSFLE